jgi:glycosyltransferase involved in cell wall biosynthesis
MKQNPKKISEIFVYPRNKGGNFYINRTIQILGRAGYHAQMYPKSLRELLTIARSSQPVMLLNWFEDRVGYDHGRIFAFVKTLILLAIIVVKFKKIIWVRHNLKPHGIYSSWQYKIICQLLSLVATATVTHRPVEGFKSQYVPHPLYEVDITKSKEQREIKFLFFGTIKQYKNIHGLLEYWPCDTKLKIAGYCAEPAYEAMLHNIIQSRNLSVEWENRFLEYDELNDLIGNTQYVILPHHDNSMIVSGVFYHAISLGANVLVRDGGFYRDYLSQFRFAHPFTLESLESTLPSLTPYHCGDILDEAKNKLSDEVVMAAWETVLNDH